MKKLFLLLGSAALLAVVAVVAASFFLGAIVRAGVNRFGPPLTKTRVELASAEISPLTGSGTIKGLVTGNPPGWHSDRAIYLGQVLLTAANAVGRVSKSAGSAATDATINAARQAGKDLRRLFERKH